jgi:hypothetical protein
MKYILTVLFCALFVSPLYSAQPQELFYIARSKNANIVRYDALMDSGGNIAQKKPIDAYWILLAKDGNREELSAFDKKAYGYKCTFDQNSNNYQLIVESFAKRPIKVYQEGKGARAEIIINSQPAYLEKIFISATSTMLIPKVHSIELFGKDKKTGAPAYEKIAM